jgi:hypothetical protein
MVVQVTDQPVERGPVLLEVPLMGAAENHRRLKSPGTLPAVSFGRWC